MESASIQSVERFVAHQFAYAEEQNQEHSKPRFHELVGGGQ